MKPPELFAALYQRFKLNLIRRAHNALYELGLSIPGLKYKWGAHTFLKKKFTYINKLFALQILEIIKNIKDAEKFFLLRELATFTLYIVLHWCNILIAMKAIYFSALYFFLAFAGFYYTVKAGKSTSTFITTLTLFTGLSKQCLFACFLTRGIQTS